MIGDFSKNMEDSDMSRAIPMLEIPSERLRGVGILSANRGEKKATLPLAGVKITAQVADRVATVIMTETFHNPYPEHLEAVYIFPLPGGADVNDFEMRVGNRVIRGKVEERGEARKQYQQAVDSGKRAAIMEKERDDVFTVQVGNIPPNEEITVKITYSERLPFFEDGAAELRLPLVVAPRYIPGQALDRNSVGDGVEQDTNLVPDASRISPPRLAEGFDPKVALGIDVTLMWDEADELGEIHNLCCSQHATRTSAGREGIKVSLAYDNELLNRDFVLRWTLSGKKLRPSLLFHRDSEGKAYGMLSLIPPYNEGQNKQARDVVFVLDKSGSMQGIKMSSAARACALLINTLGPDDRFAIQVFSSYVEWFNGSHYQKDGRFISADSAGIEQAEKYLRGVMADGGTEMHPALNQAIEVLAYRRNHINRVPVIVMLTDGEVGNESHILKEMQQKLGDSRLFTIGIDTAVNQGFLQRLADIGQGTATFVTPGAQLEEALVNVGREIGVPLIVDLSIEGVGQGLDLESIAPTKIIDLFSGRATTTFFTAQDVDKVRVKGRYPNGDRFEVIVSGKEISLPAIAQLWAKTKINDLEDRYRIDSHLQSQIKQEIISLSVQHKILTKFTAFVAIDHEEIVNEENMRRKVVQPVESPAEWDMKVHAPAPAPILAAKHMYQPGVPVARPAAPAAPAPPSLGARGVMSYTPPSSPIVKAIPQSNVPAPGSQSSGRSAPPADQNNQSLTCSGAVVGEGGGNLDKKADALLAQINNNMSLSEIKSNAIEEIDVDDYLAEDEECELDIAPEVATVIKEAFIGDLSEAKAALAGQALDLLEAASEKIAPQEAKPLPAKKQKAESQIDEPVMIEWAIKALIDAYTEVFNQEIPSPERLAQVRDELLFSINRAGLAQKLPKTLNFFTNSVISLIDSLKKGYAKAVFDTYQQTFEEVIKEIDAQFGFSLFTVFDNNVGSKIKSLVQPTAPANTEVAAKSQNVVETEDKSDSFWDSSV